MTCVISAIQRFPVKGLSPEPLDGVRLSPRQGLPGDRQLAFALAGAPFDPANPQHLPKTNFLMLQRDEALARLTTRYDPQRGTLAIEQGGVTVMEGDVHTPDGRTRLENFFQEFLGLHARPRLVEAAGHMFSDRAEKVVSFQNLASIAEFEGRVNHPVEPIRFRANIHLSGLEPWVEFTWPGKRFRIGNVLLEGVDPIRRCAATMVNPATAERDLNVPKLLTQNYDHMYMGVYARVLEGGDIATGDELTVPTT